MLQLFESRQEFRIKEEQCPASTLVQIDTVREGVQHSLFELPVVLGNGIGADVQIPDRFASECHCVIDRVGDELFIRDMNSESGTYLNGYPISRTVLEVGDRLAIGLSLFEAR